jgi:hypothetical protein
MDRRRASGGAVRAAGHLLTAQPTPRQRDDCNEQRAERFARLQDELERSRLAEAENLTRCGPPQTGARWTMGPRNPDVDGRRWRT